MSFLGEHYGRRFANRDVNIDKMIDTLMDVQSQNGVTCTMKEALFHPNTSERINVFRRKHLEKQGKLDELQPLSRTKSDNKTSNIARGVFVYDANDLEVDSDEPYVCEFCSLIGSDGVYRNDTCDLCDECEKCADYRNNQCDGCEYSILFNGGYTYGETHNVSVEDTSINEDKLLFDEFTQDDTEVKTSKNTKERFSIMNY